MSLLDDLIYGLRKVYDAAGNLLPTRSQIQFGSGLSVTDNPATGRLVVTGVSGPSGDYLPRDGSEPMTGDLSFDSGGGIYGAAHVNGVEISAEGTLGEVLCKDGQYRPVASDQMAAIPPGTILANITSSPAPPTAITIPSTGEPNYVTKALDGTSSPQVIQLSDWGGNTTADLVCVLSGTNQSIVFNADIPPDVNIHFIHPAADGVSRSQVFSKQNSSVRFRYAGTNPATVSLDLGNGTTSRPYARCRAYSMPHGIQIEFLEGPGTLTGADIASGNSGLKPNNLTVGGRSIVVGPSGAVDGAGRNLVLTTNYSFVGRSTDNEVRQGLKVTNDYVDSAAAIATSKLAALPAFTVPINANATSAAPANTMPIYSAIEHGSSGDPLTVNSALLLAHHGALTTIEQSFDGPGDSVEVTIESLPSPALFRGKTLRLIQLGNVPWELLTGSGVTLEYEAGKEPITRGKNTYIDLIKVGSGQTWVAIGDLKDL